MQRRGAIEVIPCGALLAYTAAACADELPHMPSTLVRTYQGAFFSDAQRGYVFGDAIIATAEAGATWRVVRDHIALESIFFLDAAHFRALDGSGTLLASDDAGHTITDSTPRFREAATGELRALCGTLFFVDTSKGWTVCDRYVLATVDGGLTWMSYELPHALGLPRNIWMFNVSDGIATRPFDSVLRTQSSGAQWTAVTNGPQLDVVSCLGSGFCVGLV